MEFRKGEFKAQDMRFAQVVGHVLGALRGHVPVADLRLVRALIRVLRIKGVNIDRLIKKLCHHASMFERQATWVKYVEMIERIYNRNVTTSERLSVVFEVDKAERAKRAESAHKAHRTKAKKRNE